MKIHKDKKKLTIIEIVLFYALVLLQLLSKDNIKDDSYICFCFSVLFVMGGTTVCFKKLMHLGV